jgi:hypothetical protein
LRDAARVDRIALIGHLLATIVDLADRGPHQLGWPIRGSAPGSPHKSLGEGERYADVVPALKDHYDEADLAKLLDRAPAATPDEVSVTNDGRRLDSAEAVIAFVEELRDHRAFGP